MHVHQVREISSRLISGAFVLSRNSLCKVSSLNSPNLKYADDYYLHKLKQSSINVMNLVAGDIISFCDFTEVQFALSYMPYLHEIARCILSRNGQVQDTPFEYISEDTKLLVLDKCSSYRNPC